MKFYKSQQHVLISIFVSFHQDVGFALTAAAILTDISNREPARVDPLPTCVAWHQIMVGPTHH